MTDIRANGENDAFDAGALTEQSLRMWEMPLLFGITWWNGMLAAGWLRNPPLHHARNGDHHEPAGQLVVPEPIEEEGEHALFA